MSKKLSNLIFLLVWGVVSADVFNAVYSVSVSLNLAMAIAIGFVCAVVVIFAGAMLIASVKTVLK